MQASLILVNYNDGNMQITLLNIGEKMLSSVQVELLIYEIVRTNDTRNKRIVSENMASLIVPLTWAPGFFTIGTLPSYKK